VLALVGAALIHTVIRAVIGAMIRAVVSARGPAVGVFPLQAAVGLQLLKQSLHFLFVLPQEQTRLRKSERLARSRRLAPELGVWNSVEQGRLGKAIDVPQETDAGIRVPRMEH
jgi:hypothetical protein